MSKTELERPHGDKAVRALLSCPQKTSKDHSSFVLTALFCKPHCMFLLLLVHPCPRQGSSKWRSPNEKAMDGSYVAPFEHALFGSSPYSANGVSRCSMWGEGREVQFWFRVSDDGARFAGFLTRITFWEYFHPGELIFLTRFLSLQSSGNNLKSWSVTGWLIYLRLASCLVAVKEHMFGPLRRFISPGILFGPTLFGSVWDPHIATFSPFQQDTQCIPVFIYFL